MTTFSHYSTSYIIIFQSTREGAQGNFKEEKEEKKMISDLFIIIHHEAMK